jgi:hypothetical protein
VLAPVGVRALARHVALHCEALQRQHPSAQPTSICGRGCCTAAPTSKSMVTTSARNGCTSEQCNMRANRQLPCCDAVVKKYSYVLGLGSGVGLLRRAPSGRVATLLFCSMVEASPGRCKSRSNGSHHS